MKHKTDKLLFSRRLVYCDHDDFEKPFFWEFKRGPNCVQKRIRYLFRGQFEKSHEHSPLVLSVTTTTHPEGGNFFFSPKREWLTELRCLPIVPCSKTPADPEALSWRSSSFSSSFSFSFSTSSCFSKQRHLSLHDSASDYKRCDAGSKGPRLTHLKLEKRNACQKLIVSAEGASKRWPWRTKMAPQTPLRA